MLRALGLKQILIIGLVLTQAAIFAVPAVLIALSISYVLNIIVYMILFQYTNCYRSFDVPWIAIVIGLCVGLFIPIVANTLPIQRALSRALHDALNIYHHATSELYISIIKLENMGTSLTQALIGLSLVICGILAYYLVPYSLVYGNNRLFFYVLNIILMAMIFGTGRALPSHVGMIIIAHIVYPHIQKAIGYMTTYIVWPDRNLSCCVQNNLKGHMSRNSKTAFMYMIAITFAIFAGTEFALVKNLLVSVVEMILGADLVGGLSDLTEALNEQPIRDYLDGLKQQGLVEEYTFMSGEIQDILANDASNYHYTVTLSSLASIDSPVQPARRVP